MSKAPLRGVRVSLAGGATPYPSVQTEVGGRGSEHFGFEGQVEVGSVSDSTLLLFSFFLSLGSLQI
jgi:hypothetical protein